MTYSFSTEEWLARADEIGVCAYEVIGPANRLDFTRPFMPEALARTAALTFLTRQARLRLNQIRGNAYLSISALIDDLILDVRSRVEDAGGASTLGHALGSAVEGATSGVMGAFRKSFRARFGSRCDVIGPIEALSPHLEAPPPLARALLGVHAGCMSKRHMQAAALSSSTMDPCFRRLMLHRWLDHAALAAPNSTLAEAWAPHCGTEGVQAEIEAGLAGYQRLCAGLSEALQTQALLDVASLERSLGHLLTETEREQVLAVQHHAYWWTYIGCGLTHPRFGETVRRLKPGVFAEYETLRQAFH